MPIILPFDTPAPPGATSDFAEFYKDVLPECPGLDLAFSLHVIRNVVIDFCTRTWAYQYTATGLTTAQTETLTVPAETEVTGILYVKSQRDLTQEERELDPATRRDIALAAASDGAPTHFTVNTLGDLTFYPDPDASYTYSAQLALRPTRDATLLDSDLFTRYRMGIARGILYRLQIMPNKPWSSPTLALQHGQEYSRAIREARIELSKTFTSANLQVDMSLGSF